ncbi:hypothetical protein AMECASPLE_032153, partial [Ameca splendens]
WRLAKDPAQAAKRFKQKMLSEHASGKSLELKMDVKDTEEDRERALLSFYKHEHQWACPLLSTLEGGTGRTLLFEDPELATIVIEDCTDLHVGSIIKALEQKELSQEQKDVIYELCLSWDLPAVTKTNQRWLHNKLLVHAVIGRTMRQIKQCRKGLKYVMVWPLLTSKPDVVPILFPKMAQKKFTPQVILEKITWPVEDSDEEDEEFDLETKWFSKDIY